MRDELSQYYTEVLISKDVMDQKIPYVDKLPQDSAYTYLYKATDANAGV